MVIWALAKKELRLLLRDRMAVVVLLGMPLVFILLWGLMLGENFGQKNGRREAAHLPGGPRTRARASVPACRGRRRSTRT